jgi:hypothetical protein
MRVGQMGHVPDHIYVGGGYIFCFRWKKVSKIIGHKHTHLSKERSGG